MQIDMYAMAIEELVFDDCVSLGRCSRSTAYRWEKEINSRLNEGYPFRVQKEKDASGWCLRRVTA